jgi:hypothetical protein
MSGYEPAMTERLDLGQIALLPPRLLVGSAVIAGGLPVICSCCGLMRHDRPDSQSLDRCRGVQ